MTDRWWTILDYARGFSCQFSYTVLQQENTKWHLDPPHRMSLQVTMMICFYDLTHQERCQVPWLMALAPKTWYAKGAGVENYPGCHEFQTQCFCFSGLPSLCLWMCWQVLDGDQTVVLHRRRTHQWTACQPAAYKDQWSRENISQMFYLLLMLRKKKNAVLEGGTGRWR